MATVKIDGVKAPEWLRITGVTFPVFPDITHKETVIPLRYGNLDGGVELGGKDIGLNVVIMLNGSNIHERAQELKRWLIGDDIQKLSKFTFTESEEYYYMVRPTSNVMLNDLIVAGEGTINLRSSDGVRYRDGIRSVEALGKEINVNYAGDEETPFKLVLEPLADTSEIKVKNSRTGKEISLSGHFKNGSTVSIYTDRKLVQVNDITDMNRLSFSSRWLRLLKGKNLIKVESAEDVDFNINLEYSERY